MTTSQQGIDLLEAADLRTHGLNERDVMAALAAAADPGGANPFVTRARLPINVRDYGAIGNGTADDTPSIQAAIDATIGKVSSGRGGVLFFPAGVYRITDTLTIETAIGLTMQGAGRDTIITWSGNSTDPAILIADSQQCMLSDFEIAASSDLAAAVQMKRTGAVSYANRKNRFSNIFINDPTNIVDGFVIGGAGAYDANNDFNLFENCFSSTSRYNFHITHSQSYNNMFINCDAWNGVNGLRVDHGYFQWQGGSMFDHSSYDFYHTGMGYISNQISGVVSEGSQRFLYSVQLAGPNFEVRDCRWSAGGLAADGVFIHFVGPGHLRMIGNTFGDSMAIESIDLLIEYQAGRDRADDYFTGSSFEFVGNLMYTDQATPPNPFTFDPPSFMKNNRYRDESTSQGPEMPVYGQLLTVDAATPDVSSSQQYWTEQNSNATSITDFLKGHWGKELTIVFTTSNTTIVSGSAIRLAGGANFSGTPYDVLTLYHNGTCWIEVGRSVNA